MADSKNVTVFYTKVFHMNRRKNRIEYSLFPKLDDVSNNVPPPVAKPNPPPIVAAPTPPANPTPMVAPPPIAAQPIIAPVAVGAGPVGPGGPVQPPQTSTSWAAAAGKGLPTTTNDQTHTTSTASAASNGSTSKHLEQLNSVREALFSQDGWGGSNVKQDSAWNVDGVPPGGSGSSTSTTNPGTGTANASSTGSDGPKESNTWGTAGSGHRNDGTDLWRVNLSGQPPAPKPQPNNAWNHTPQNNTDFKQWGVDEEDGSGPADRGNGPPGPNANGAIGGQRGQMGNNVGSMNNAGPGGLGGGNTGGPVGGGNDSMWGSDANNGPGNSQFNKRANDWNSSGSGSSWGNDGGGPRADPMMNRNMGDPMMNRNMGDMPMGGHRDTGNNSGGIGSGPVGSGGGSGGWGPSPQKQPISQWSSNPGGPGPRNNPSWDLESPNMQRRGVDDGGTSHWGFKPQQSTAPGNNAGKKFRHILYQIILAVLLVL